MQYPAGQKVAGARVAARAEAYQVLGTTSADGEVKLKLPAADGPLLLLAWHPALGVAGELQRNPQGDSYELTLLAAALHTIRVVDVDERPVGNWHSG